MSGDALNSTKTPAAMKRTCFNAAGVRKELVCILCLELLTLDGFLRVSVPPW
jgi:hypothetical protein